MTTPTLITRPAAARRLGATAGVVQRLIAAGHLAPAYRIGGRVMVSAEAVEAYLDAARITPASA
ncbi:helix-turn-helix domain-containing protein [Tsukamurella soli]|uniref:Helix-turn-helix domain-containing protein n=1 Tax=Tsukamurella soli TaxID=644556 RepID=A0ABP8KKN7_9ACTN